MNTLQNGNKLAVLVSNGFNEKDLVDVQRVLLGEGVSMRIISMDNGLTSSWNGSDWGLNFAADSALNTALAADYDMLVVPGGQRSVDKLKHTAHTRRFINGFVDQSKPVVVMGEALELLEFAGKLSGMTVCGDEAKREMAEQAGATWVEDGFVVDGMVMTGPALSEDSADYVSAIKDFLVADYTMMDEAA